jgi:hypothetical protein
MYTCGVCHFQVEMDDVSLPGPNGHCVCLGCYLRETDQWQAMPKALRNELTAVLTDAPQPQFNTLWPVDFRPS